MKTSYSENDVKLLLKDITGLVKPQPASEREKLIQSGTHYCEMLPLEYVPSQEYMEVYKEALRIYAKPVAEATGRLADKIIQKRGRDVVLVSLARAGIPIGILLKRYLKYKYNISVYHYSVSIIRGRGIDKNAMAYLLGRYDAGRLLFVDGWIGKGAILNELKKDLKEFPGVNNEIAVLADPAFVTDLCGTHDDILIPSSCLNCTVSGLISRTFLRSDIIGENDFHGAAYYSEFESSDLSYEFINAIEKEFVLDNPMENIIAANKISRKTAGKSQTDKDKINKNKTDKNQTGKSHLAEEQVYKDQGIDEVKEIAREFGINDINLIKPGIGETTRVLLRRIPWKVLISEGYKNSQETRHIIKLAEEKNVPVQYYPLRHYKTCGIIKKMADT